MPKPHGLKVLIATTRVPFIDGGAELLAEGLRQAVQAAGHRAEILSIPFKWYPPERMLDQMLACRLLGGGAADCLIGLKFPAYLIPHPRKVSWLLHQHRQAYELWQHPMGDLHNYANGAAVRQAIHYADRELLPEARSLFAISRNVAARLRKYCGLEAEPLYHPPPDARNLASGTAEDFLYFPSRVNPLKRQHLVIQALAHTRTKVRVCFSRPDSEPGYDQTCLALARKLKIQKRVEWLGSVSLETKRDLYARALGVVYPPLDEDYGYVTLEAMLAAKPVITCRDSGGSLEFVCDRQTGLISEATPEALAAAMDELWENRAAAREWGAAGRDRYSSLHIGWDHVLEKLLQ
jgi:glycosyltransferase involved in cell wall biosynthesis